MHGSHEKRFKFHLSRYCICSDLLEKLLYYIVKWWRLNADIFLRNLRSTCTVCGHDKFCPWNDKLKTNTRIAYTVQFPTLSNCQRTPHSCSHEPWAWDIYIFVHSHSWIFRHANGRRCHRQQADAKNKNEYINTNDGRLIRPSRKKKRSSSPYFFSSSLTKRWSNANNNNAPK